MDPRLQRISRLSHGLRIALRSAVLALASTAVLLLFVLAPGEVVERTVEHEHRIAAGGGEPLVVTTRGGVEASFTPLWSDLEEKVDGPVPLSAKIAWTLLAVPWLALWLGVLYQVDRLLVLYEGGSIFDPRCALRIRNVGMLVFAAPLVGFALPLLEAALEVGLGLSSDFLFELGLDLGDLMLLFVGASVTVVGRVMHEAALLSEDAALTV